MVSKAVYVKATLFLILLFLAGLSLLVFFFVGVVGALITGSYLLFLGGLFYFFVFIVLTFIVRKLEPAWEEVQARLGFKEKPKTTKEALKESLPYFGILIVAFAVYGILEWYFNLFPPTISKELAGEMVRSILTIDGILLGFYGVILAQFLWAIHSKGNLIYEQMITHKTDNDVIVHLIEESNRLNKDRLWVVVSMFYAAMPILASFLLCLTKLPLTEGSGIGNDTIAVRTVMYDPTAALIAGIILVVFVSLATNLLPRRGRWPAEVTPA
jgi:hypothetical protein